MGGDISMDMSTILQMVSTVGFPIVACAAMAWYIGKKMDPILDVLNQVKALLSMSSTSDDSDV